MGKKVKVERCCICNKIVDTNDKSIKVKEKMLFEDKDGIWYNFKNTYICSSCTAIIKDMVKA